MISREKAKALKEAGVDPDEGYKIETGGEVIEQGDSYSLGYLLAEIEARGHRWTLRCFLENKSYACYLIDSNNDDVFQTEDADTPEDAAADALIWILEQSQ